MAQQRTLADLVHSEAPVSAKRALAITLAITEELVDRADNSRAVGPFDATQVVLASDGSVSFSEDTGWSSEPAAVITTGGSVSATLDPVEVPSACASSIGQVLFQLLTTRPPLSPADAFEPAVTSALTPSLSALIVRSVSDSPAQWPSLQIWMEELGGPVGGSATLPPPHRQRRDRRRAVVSLLVLLTLAAISLLIVLKASGWWDDAVKVEGAITAVRVLPWPGRS